MQASMQGTKRRSRSQLRVSRKILGYSGFTRKATLLKIPGGAASNRSGAAGDGSGISMTFWGGAGSSTGVSVWSVERRGVGPPQAVRYEAASVGGDFYEGAFLSRRAQSLRCAVEGGPTNPPRVWQAPSFQPLAVASCVAESADPCVHWPARRRRRSTPSVPHQSLTRWLSVCR